MYQKLLTQKDRKRLPAIGATDGTPLENKTVVVKFFKGAFTWYVFEGAPLDEAGRDYEFFGYVDGHCGEMGYFHLSQLESVKAERDMYFDPKPFHEVKDELFARGSLVPVSDEEPEEEAQLPGLAL